jgi:LmbE family N-acetylglucosaminyl deacetylase
VIGVVAGFAALIWYVPVEFTLFPASPPTLTVEKLDVAKAFPKGTRVTLVTAHPDDAEFYLGATLPQIRDAGADISLVVVTDGDKGYYPFEDADANRRVRRVEQTDAARRWGARDVQYLGFPDGRVHSGDELNSKIREALERLHPEVILSFDDQYPPRRHHADHARTGEAVAAILPSLKGVRAIGRFSTEAPNRVADATTRWAEKLELMKVHKSQFDTKRTGFFDRLIGRGGDDPFAFISGIVEGMARTDGARIKVPLGEGLRWSDL